MNKKSNTSTVYCGTVSITSGTIPCSSITFVSLEKQAKKEFGRDDFLIKRLLQKLDFEFVLTAVTKTRRTIPSTIRSEKWGP